MTARSLAGRLRRRYKEGGWAPSHIDVASFTCCWDHEEATDILRNERAFMVVTLHDSDAQIQALVGPPLAPPSPDSRI